MDPDRVSMIHVVRKKLKQQQRDDVAKNFLVVGGFSSLAALLMFVLHILMARYLGPHQYADYGTYVAVLFTALFALSGIHLVITRFVTYHRTRHQNEEVSWLVHKALRWLFAAGFVLFLLIVFSAKPLSDFFRLESLAATVLLGFVLWFVLLIPVFEGALKGLEDFRNVGVLRLIESFVRLIVAIALVLLGFDVAGAVFALGVGTFVALMVSYSALHQLNRLHAHKPETKKIFSFARPVFISTTSLALLLNLDLLMVKHYFISLEAGIFAAASLFAKVPFFVSIVLVGVLFPKITRLHSEGKKTGSLLRSGLLTLLPLVLLVSIIAFFFSGPVFSLIFGSRFTIGPELGLYSLAMGVLALAHLVIAYLLAIKDVRVAFGLPALVLVLALLLHAYHDSLLQVIISVLIAMMLLGAFVFWRARNYIDFDLFLRPSTK